MEQKIKFFITLTIGIAILLGFFIITQNISKFTGNSILNNSENKDDLAKCLTEKGAKMYGAYWCGHCKNQKDLFGTSFQYINHIECDAGGENANPLACQNAGIQGYPTWIINNQQYPGEQSFDKLKQLTGC